MDMELDLNLPPPSPTSAEAASDVKAEETTRITPTARRSARLAKKQFESSSAAAAWKVADTSNKMPAPPALDSSTPPTAPPALKKAALLSRQPSQISNDEKLGKKRSRQTVVIGIDEVPAMPPPPVRNVAAPQPRQQARDVRESAEMGLEPKDDPGNVVSSSRPDALPAAKERGREKPQFQRPNMRRHHENGGDDFRAPGKRQAAFKRATVCQPADASIERLHREATCSKLWQQSGQPAEAEFQRVPGSFTSLEEYVQVFEPLLFEECRAQLYNVWEELRDSGKDVHVPAMIRSVDKRDRGWYDVTLLPVDTRSRFNFKEGDVAVLSTPPQDAQRKSEDLREEGEISVHIAGTVRRYTPLDVRDTHGAVMFIHFSEGAGDMGGGGYPSHLLEELRRGVVWSFTVLGGLATTQREYVALHALYRLHPQMISAILQPRPELFPRYDQEQAGALGCFTPAFVAYLRSNFNPPQLSAIQWAAMHTAAGTAATARTQETWPFSLVQGPPGTGKTHTVWGMLNAIHLVQYQRYYAALLKKIAPGAVASDNAAGGEDEQGGWIDEVLQKMDKSLHRQLPRLCPKPRMLVCAPSNAATDELLARVLDKGFMDGEMRTYRPDVARVGTDPQSKAAQAVSVEKRTETLIGKGREEIVEWLQRMRHREYALSQHIALLQRDLNASRIQGAVGVEPELLAARDQARDMKLQQLASLLEERDKVLVDMSRFVIVDNLLKPGGGYNMEDAKSKLEASFANEAEIVFTTVSSSGRKLFTNLARGFDIVVIDEAAQASELGVLPPLILGAARCVLVGDPQQLPATVISRVADTMHYSRSLFERFQQAGCPTLMLTVQYRMHPQIRDFPSRYFYQGRLQDSDSVKALPDEIYHHDPLLQPYLFFDVSHGKESHMSGSVSFQNVVEAKFAARLYDHLQGILKAAGKQAASVGVISPYKLQLRCIQREFESLSGDAKGVYINTVDAFQGQERDVIIMSCVRASSHGVGFVADIRRMNVALTRARRSLWVIGNANTLLQSEDWAALIQDAKSRNCFVTSAAAMEKGLISDGFLTQVVKETGSSSRLDGYRGNEGRAGTREHRAQRRGRYEAEPERKTADSYLRQHNNLRRGV